MLTLAAVGFAGLSFVYSMLTGAVALDACRQGCDLTANVAIMGIGWGGIVVAGLAGGIGVKRARARHRLTSPWALLALVIVVVSGVVSVVIVNVVAGLL